MGECWLWAFTPGCLSTAVTWMHKHSGVSGMATCVCSYLYIFSICLPPPRKKKRKESGEMYPVSIVISGLHGLLYYLFQLLVLNLSVDKYIFGLLSSAKWMPLTATMRLMECNSVICSLGGFSVIDVWFQIFRIFVCFLWIVPVCCVKMINKVNY